MRASATRATAASRDAALSAHLASVLRVSSDALVTLDGEGRVTGWNTNAERLFGWSEREVLGRVAIELHGAIGPSFEACTGGCHDAPAEDGTTVCERETERRRRDGTTVDVLERIALTPDAAGRPLAMTCWFRDLAQVKREGSVEQVLRDTEEQLRQAQKLEAVGRLAGGVAHDFNNILSVILGYTTILLDDLRDGDPVREDVSEIHSAGKRAIDLTRQLLAFSRRQVLRPKVLDVDVTMRGVQRMIERLLGEDVSMHLDLGAHAHVLADPGQIEQVVMNLAVNARDAMPEGGRLTIETSGLQLDAASAARFDLRAGPYVQIAVSDTGHGMDAPTRARAFEPFFTTKDVARGTGLGLSTVFGIVKQSRGHVWIESEVGRGTTVRILLPRLGDGIEAEARSTEIPPPPSSACETVLLCEDDDQVRGLARHILKRAGYVVLEAANAGEAILLADQHPGPIDVLVSDVVMPRASGRQLAEHLVRSRPTLKVLFVSGYTDDTVLHHGVKRGRYRLLPKPFSPSSLASAVREVLEGDSTVAE